MPRANRLPTPPISDERMWWDETAVWQAVFAPRDPRIVYAFILRAGDVTLLQYGRHAPCRRTPRMGERLPYAHAYPAKEKPQWARGVGYQIFPDRFRRVDVPGRRPSSRGAASAWRTNIASAATSRAFWRPCRIWPKLGVGVVHMTPIFPFGPPPTATHVRLLPN